MTSKYGLRVSVPTWEGAADDALKRVRRHGVAPLACVVEWFLGSFHCLRQVKVMKTAVGYGSSDLRFSVARCSHLVATSR